MKWKKKAYALLRSYLRGLSQLNASIFFSLSLFEE